MKRIRKTTNSIFAIPAAAPAIPAKPKTAAINAMIRKVIAHPNIVVHLLLEFFNSYNCNFGNLHAREFKES
jgi:hypothetical protein